MNQESSSIIIVQNVFFWYEAANPVLQDISFAVQRGEFLSILGPSGCGKSTLLNLLGGFIQPNKGVIRLNEQKIEKPGTERGIVFQELALFPWYTVRENIEYPLNVNKKKFQKSSSQERRRISDHFLEMTGLNRNGFEKRYPHQLSGGERQRVAIARTFAANPEVLLMDEPFGSLDTQTRVEMQEWLLELWRRDKKTTIFVTHDVEEAILLSDRILVMSGIPGKIKAGFEVALPRPRSYKNAPQEDFFEIKMRLLSLLRKRN